MIKDNTPLTALLPIAGKGSRLHPLTIASSKEMLPLYNRPILDYAILAALHAGVKKIILIIHPNKKDIIAYCDRTQNKWFDTMLQPFEDSEKIDIIITYQQVQKGLGHAVLQGKDYIGNNSFFVISPDDVIIGNDFYLTAMTYHHQANHCQANYVLVDHITAEQAPSYGVLDVDYIDGDLIKAKSIIEKPSVKYTPSSYGAIAHYLLSPDIMNVLKDLPSGKNDEIQLTDALATMIDTHTLYGVMHDAHRYDCGYINGLYDAQLAMKKYITEKE